MFQSVKRDVTLQLVLSIVSRASVVRHGAPNTMLVSLYYGVPYTVGGFNNVEVDVDIHF